MELDERVIAALDGSRRAGWAKFYAERAECDRLRGIMSGVAQGHDPEPLATEPAIEGPTVRADWSAAICDSNLPPTERAVGQAMARYASSSGDVWCSATTIAHDTGFSLRTARRARGALAAAGWLQLTRPGGSQRSGRRLTSEYQLSTPPKETT